MTQMRGPVKMKEIEGGHSEEDEENEEDDSLRFNRDKLEAYTDGCVCINCNRKMATVLREDKHPRLKAISEMLLKFHASDSSSSFYSAKKFFDAVVTGDAGL
jgi:hypothetical protein